MKVAIINTVVGTGSVGRIACGTADEVIRNGGEVLLCRGRGDAMECYVNYRIGSDFDMYLHGVLSRVTDKQGLYSKGATKGLINRLKEYDPDLIQVHNVHGYYVNYTMLFNYLKSCGKPIVWTLHDCWSFTGHCVHFEACGCDKWEAKDGIGCFDCPEKNEYPASYMRDSSKSNYRIKQECFRGIPRLMLVTPSEWLKVQVGRSFIKEYPVQVINTGIDLEDFSPADDKTRSAIREKYGIGDRTLLLGVANPWRVRKGFNDFAELYKMLEARFPGKYAVALIGPQNPRQIELPEGIIRIGHTDSVKELAGWYSTADIYVNLTYEDTFPTTNIEALACGTPVITYNAGGSVEILGTEPLNEDEGEQEKMVADIGAVISRGNLEGVIEDIGFMVMRLLADEDGEVARHCVDRAAHYARQDKFREYYKLYEEMLGGAGKA